MTSGMSRCLYSFCPEIFLEDDDSGVFNLFADLYRLLDLCKLQPSDEMKGAVEELGSCLIEKQGHHVGSGQLASDIQDVAEYPLQDFGFQFPHRLLHVFKLCCLIIETPRVTFPVVSNSLSGGLFSENALQN